MKTAWRVLPLILLLTAALHSEEIYTTSLLVKKSGDDRIRISWQANTNRGNFSIWCGIDQPLKSLTQLSNSALIFSNFFEGTNMEGDDLFTFTHDWDKIARYGDYYFLVLPTAPKYLADDFAANMNYNIRAFKFSRTDISAPASNTNASVASSSPATNSLPSTNAVVVPAVKTNVSTLVVSVSNSVTVTNNVLIQLPPTYQTNRVELVITNFVKGSLPVETAKGTNAAAGNTNDYVLGASIVQGIVLEKMPKNKISIEWTAVTNRGKFTVYRSEGFSIKSRANLKEAVKVGTYDLTGLNYQGSYRYTGVSDQLETSGYYYYAVVPEEGERKLPVLEGNRNFTLTPIIFEVFASVSTELAVNSIQASKSEKTVRLSWSVSGAPKISPEYVFQVYRTTNRIREPLELFDIEPYREIRDDFVLEDTGLQKGVPYYYTVVLNGKMVVQPGQNQLTGPVVFGETNIPPVPVVLEIRKTNITADEFGQKFIREKDE